MKKDISREEKIRKAIELRKERRSYRQIGEWLGVSHVTVINWCSNMPAGNNLPPGKSEGSDGKEYPAEKPTDDELTERRKKVKTLLDEGKKVADIAQQVGKSESTVYNDIKANEKADIDEDKRNRRGQTKGRGQTYLQTCREVLRKTKLWNN